MMTSNICPLVCQIETVSRWKLAYYLRFRAYKRFLNPIVTKGLSLSLEGRFQKSAYPFRKSMMQSFATLLL